MQTDVRKLEKGILLPRQRLLYIEDEAVLAEGIKSGLEKNGVSMNLTADGQTSLLPARDGWSVCETLRHEHQHRSQTIRLADLEFDRHQRSVR